MARGRSLQGIIEQEEFKHDLTPSFEMAEMPVPNSRRRAQTPPAVHQTEATDFKLESSPEKGDIFDQAPKLGDNPVPVLSPKKAPAGSTSPTRPSALTTPDVHFGSASGTWHRSINRGDQCNS